MSYSPAHLRDLLNNPAWKEIVERVEAEAQHADEQMESTNEFDRLVAIGKRRTLRMLLALPDQLKKELDENPLWPDYNNIVISRNPL